MRPLKKLQVLQPDICRLVLCAGAAAGIAANINLPLTGICFAIEVYGRLYRTSSGSAGLSLIPTNSSCIRFILLSVVSTISALAVMRFGVQSIPSHVLSHSLAAIPGSLLLQHIPFFAVLGGIVSLACLVLIRSRENFAKTWHAFPFPWQSRSLLGFCVMLIGSYCGRLDFGLAQGNLILKESLTHGVTLQTSLVVVVSRLLLTPFMQSAGQLGGLFAPALFIGGAIGNIVVHLFTSISPILIGDFERYMIVRVGALTMLSVILRAPLTSMALLVEVCPDWRLVVALSFSLVLANFSVDNLAAVFEIENVSRERPKVIPATHPFAFPL